MCLGDLWFLIGDLILGLLLFRVLVVWLCVSLGFAGGLLFGLIQWLFISLLGC